MGIAALILTLGVNNGDDASSTPTGAPVVGGDLHTLFRVHGQLFVGGHTGAAVSDDGGATWRQLSSLTDADPMGWAAFDTTVLAGGHPGLYRSEDGGKTFTQVSGTSAIPDVHALGGTGDVIYAASPSAGVLASEDGGKSWIVRNPAAGRSFMGTILVDATDTDRIIAPDMAGGLAVSNDGGRNWSPSGGPSGAMAAAGNPRDQDEIVAIGMQAAGRSTDGGSTWTSMSVPPGTRAMTFSADGSTLYAASLQGDGAVVYKSVDDGKSWTPASAS